MSVLIVNDCYERSSAAGAAVTTAEALAAAGVEVHFLASVQDPEKVGAFEANGVQVHEVFVPAYPIRWRAFRSLNNPPAVRAFEEQVKALKPEVIHFQNLHIHFSYACLTAAKKSGARVVLTVHDVMPFCNQKMFCHLDESLVPDRPVDYRARFHRCLACVRFRFNPFRNRIIRSRLTDSVDRVVAVSQPMRDALEQNRIPVHRVIGNGIDCTKWQPDAEKARAFREKMGLTGLKIALYGGRVDYLKGGLHLVRALARLRPEFPEARLLILGKQSLFLDQMNDLAESLGIGDALVLPGWLSGEDLIAAYGAADLIASPSLCFESFNLMNLEGMAMAKPVVSSFFGGPSEVVVDGITGFLVNPLHIEALSDKMATLFGDSALARKMGQNGRERAVNGYSLKKNGQQTLALYEDLR